MGDNGESDEWATVETVPDDISQNEEMLKDPVPQSVNFVSLAVDFVSSNGWFIVIGLAVLYIVYQKVRTKLESATSDREAAEHHKNPDDVVARQEAMEAARRRMQEMYDRQAAAHAEKLKEKEEMQRLQKLEDWERHKQGLGYRSKTKVSENDTSQDFQPKPKTTKPKLRPEYNPLMGDTGGTCFRSARRGMGGG